MLKEINNNSCLFVKMGVPEVLRGDEKNWANDNGAFGYKFGS